MDKDEVILVTDHARGAVPADKPGLFARIRGNFLEYFSYRHFRDKWRDVPTTLRFRCTNRCNENCPHCFECSGPNNPLQVLPPEDIAFYQNELPQLESVFITGGEWSLIYDIDPDYMLHVFKGLDLSKAAKYSIQTNCRWVSGQKSQKIFSDLIQVQDNLAAAGKMLTLDVSVDRHHSAAALNGVRDLICHVGADKRFNNTKVRVMSSAEDRCMANETVLKPEYFAARGVDLRFEPRPLSNQFFQVFYANNKRMVIHEEGPVMRIGRAAQNNIGYEIIYPERQCGGIAGDNRFWELSFREDGTVKWHSYYDWNIVVPYKDASGRNKPIDQIKEELLKLAWRRHLKQSLREAAWALIPYIGEIRRLNKEIQMLDSFYKNCAAVTLHVKEL